MTIRSLHDYSERELKSTTTADLREIASDHKLCTITEAKAMDRTLLLNVIMKVALVTKERVIAGKIQNAINTLNELTYEACEDKLRVELDINEFNSIDGTSHPVLSAVILKTILRT